MKLFYREFGAGFPLIILHGLYGSSDNWFTYGRKLSEKYHVYLVDQRNHGQSPHSEMFDFELMRDDLFEFYRDHNIRRAIIIGHSMGGKTAMYFAASFPEKVEKLIIVDIAPKSYKLLPAELNQVNGHKKIIAALSAVDLSKYNSREEIDQALAKDIVHPKVRQFLLKNLKRNDNGGFFWSLNIKAIEKNFDFIFDVCDNDLAILSGSAPSMPVLFVKGELSNYVVESDYEKIHEIFPNSAIKIISGTGHWLHAEKPEEFIKIVSEFLG
ncbi:MAG: alpha/beta fold hydrolase [Bacteroidales bacterium]|nr:alpha/beta fold hydrolase [Bacteroidales bacterium]